MLANAEDGMWVCVRKKVKMRQRERKRERDLFNRGYGVGGGGFHFAFKREMTDGKRGLEETTGKKSGKTRLKKLTSRGREGRRK